MKISEKQIHQLFHICYASTFNSNNFGGFSQKERKEFVQDIVDQQSKEIVDTRDFELMKLNNS